MATSFFIDQEARAHPGSFGPRVVGESIGLPPAVAEIARSYGTSDAEEFAAVCTVFAKDVAQRLHWGEAEVSRAVEQLNLLIGQPVTIEPQRYALGALAPPGMSGLTARELAARKRQTGDLS